jgi:glycosyltransferase involved in cell wall biosynthesis
MTIRVLAVMEALTVTGPAKNLLQFGRWAREQRAQLPRVELTIAAYTRGEARTNAFLEAAREQGFPVEVLHERQRFDPGIVGQLRQLIARVNPDIYQTHNVKTNFLSWLVRPWRDRPWVSFHHGYTWTSQMDRLYTKLNRFSVRHASQVVTVCQPFVEQMVEVGVARERVAVLHNTVKPFTPLAEAERAEVRARLGIPADGWMLVTVGRLSAEKAHADLVEAFGRLAGRYPGARLVIVGDGPERGPLAEQAARAGIADQIVFTGHQSDVRPYYGAADLFVLPSHTEGSPNALLEAMAAGLPSVATRVGGVPEIAPGEETALVVESRDPEQFAAAMERLLGDAARMRRMGDTARERVMRLHTLDEYGARLTGIYSGLLARR